MENNPDKHIAVTYATLEESVAAYQKIQDFLYESTFDPKSEKYDIAAFNFINPANTKEGYYVCALGTEESIEHARSTIEAILRKGKPVQLTDDYLAPMREYRDKNNKMGVQWREDHLI